MCDDNYSFLIYGLVGFLVRLLRGQVSCLLWKVSRNFLFIYFNVFYNLVVSLVGGKSVARPSNYLVFSGMLRQR